MTATRARRPLRARRGLAAAGVLAAALVLTGCVPSFLFPQNPERTSTPVDEDVDAALAPFYGQVLSWEDCEDVEGMLCATATAPLDWDDPAAGSVDLALVRQPASGDKLGSLLVNPGGPGGSGFDFVADSIDYAVGEPLQQRYDIVGFDPRGVGRSSAIACLDAAAMDDYLYGLAENPRGTDGWIAEVEQNVGEFGAACAENSGDLLGHVDTVSAARDLDLLRAVLGDEKLNYLGYSYGTFLGATYAGLYPEKVGRLVLDGAIDPAASDFDVTSAQAQGFEQALSAYLEDCLGRDDCPFPASGGVDGALADVRALLDSVDASPLRGSDGRELGADALLTAIIYPLYSPDAWSYLDDLFTSVEQGEADFALALADAYNGRDPDGTYADNSTEAFKAINCLDYPAGSTDPAEMRAQNAELEAAAPIIGTYMGFGALACAGWPDEPTGLREEIHANGADPILVIGTTGDPATPYQWAVSLADQLDSGVLVSYDGEGHTAYNKGSDCVNGVVESYFLDGDVPGSDPNC
ncbi:alpha/beta fold hydrolase [Agromyces seonyuensis]|uniref:Alpha/beta fold hydrolase n=1 Tax=Agromyces seonyuensis TaxID=2662446 RepID=A0A6I4P693_9MICO|nr:alpha/beta fold hydrolase [Agromyces seonyuensis]